MNKKLYKEKLTRAKEELIDYSCRKLIHQDAIYLSFVQLTYNIIMSAVYDSQFGNSRTKKSADEYLNSFSFIYDCNLMKIELEYILKIIRNIDDVVLEIKQEEIEDEDDVYFY